MAPSLLARVLAPIFTSRPPPTKKVDSDNIAPVHLFDDLPGYRNALLMWTFQFNDVLDADKLHRALWELIEHGEGWRKLGGRVRVHESGKLEIHIPQQFSADRPPVQFSHIKIDSSIKDHPVASRFPKADPNKRPSTHPGPRIFADLAIPNDAPRNLEDYVFNDQPQLTLHIVSFTDATLVSLLFLHTVCDEMGLATLFRAWQSVLAGNRNIPRYLGFKDDPMAAFYNAEPVEKHAMAPYEMRGMKLAWWVLKFAIEIWRRPKFEARTICIPPATLAAMRRQATGDLARTYGSENVPFISDGDILLAWTTQIASQSEPRDSKRSCTIRIPIDTRGRCPDVFPADAASVSNSILLVYVLLPVAQLLNAPLGETALEVRKNILAQSTRTQFDALARLAVESLGNTKSIPFMGDTSTFLLSVSNWAKANFYDLVDFSPAVVKEGQGPGHQPGRVAFYHSKPVSDGFFISPIFTIAGKDTSGNYWLTGDMIPALWPVLEKSLQDFASRA